MGGLLDLEVLAAAREIVRRLRKSQRVWVVLEPDGRIVVLLVILALLMAGCGSVSRADQPARPAATPTVSPESEWARRFVIMEWHLVEEYGTISVVGELRNNNDVPVGVQLLITAYDEDDQVVDSSSCWPASFDNVPAKRKYPIDCPVTAREGVERVTLRIEGAKQWD